MQDANLRNRTSGSQIPRPMLASVRELNYRFLDLIGVRARDRDSADDWSSPGRAGLPREICTQIAALSDAQKKAAANCPYALFDLRFQDESYWQARLQSAAPPAVSDGAPLDDGLLGFARLAIFFAWHVASAGRLQARLLLGMGDVLSGAFRDLTVGCLPALAATEAVQLTARWNGSPAYWSALARAASRPHSAGLRRIQLSGLQLAAATRLTWDSVPGAAKHLRSAARLT